MTKSFFVILLWSAPRYCKHCVLLAPPENYPHPPIRNLTFEALPHWKLKFVSGCRSEVNGALGRAARTLVCKYTYNNVLA